MIRSFAVLVVLAGCAGTTAYTGATPPIIGTLPAPVARHAPAPVPKGGAAPHQGAAK